MEKFLKICMKSFVTKAFGLEHYIKVLKDICYLCHFISLSNYNLFGIFFLISFLVFDFTLNNNFLNSKHWKFIWITDDRRNVNHVRVRSQRDLYCYLAGTWSVWNVTMTWQYCKPGLVLSVMIRSQRISTLITTIQQSKCSSNKWMSEIHFVNKYCIIK